MSVQTVASATYEQTLGARGDQFVFALQFLGVAGMAIGWGIVAGTFVQPVTTGFGQFADLLHILPLVALLPLSLRYFGATLAPTGAPASRARTGVTIVAVFSILAMLVFVLLGASNPDPASVGVHTFEDAMPVIVMTAAVSMWVAGLIAARRHATGPNARPAAPESPTRA